MKHLQKLALYLSGICFMIFAVAIMLQIEDLWKPALVLFSVSLSVGIAVVSFLKGYQYTAWIFSAVIAAMVYPNSFLKLGTLNLRDPWLILIVVQLVMFGMGTQMRLKDFKGLATSGKGVLIGLICQFTIMPLMGYILTQIFKFEAEIAAGIILIGACSSGLASNVMVYISKSNLLLSVTVTAIATMFAPLMTPLMMKFYAGTLVELDFIGMVVQIVKIVLVPIGAALFYDYLKGASKKAWRFVTLLAILCVFWMLFLSMGGWRYLETRVEEYVMLSVEVSGFLAGAILVGISYYFATKKLPKLNDYMPYVSMFGIIYFTAVTTAAGRDHLLQVGGLLFIASVLHNSAGYFFGYWFSRAARLDKQSARAMAFEVGMQNGGMASGLAGVMGKLGTLGLAAAVFSPWMNISGSILANYWKHHPVVDSLETTHVKGFEKI